MIVFAVDVIVVGRRTESQKGFSRVFTISLESNIANLKYLMKLKINFPFLFKYRTTTTS